MLKLSQKFLSVVLTVVSIATFINVLLIYWLPINIPISSFFAVRTMFVAFIEKRYFLIVVSLLVCVLLFLTTISIRRQHILFPTLSLIYIIYDFIIILPLLIGGLDNGYWITYIIQTIVSIVLIVSLCIYCWNYLKINNT